MKKILLLNLIMTISFAQAKVGSEGVGGGDVCENRIKIVRDDIQNWIKDGGVSKLDLTKSVRATEYSKGMLSYIERTKVRCVSDGDIGFPVSVEGVPKVCRFEKNEMTSIITCDYNKFLATSQSNQYLLIHHEYAGLADVEIPNGSDSDYSISNQIIPLLDNQPTKQLRSHYEALQSYEILNPNLNSDFSFAWGVPGRKINFNFFKNLPSEEKYSYIRNNNAQNFLVDNVTEKIVMTLHGPTLFLDDGYIRGGNHYELGLSSLLIEGLSDCGSSVGVIEKVKWGSDLIYIAIKDGCYKNAPIVIDTTSLNISIQEQMKSLFKKRNTNIFKERAMSIEVLGATFFKGQWLNRINYYYYVPKSDKIRSVNLEAKIKFIFNNQMITAKVISVEEREDIEDIEDTE